MKKTFLLLTLFSVAVFISSCKKESKGAGEGFNASADKDLIERTSKSMQTDLTELFQSEGLEAIVTLTNHFGEDDFSGDNLRTLKGTDFRSRVKKKADSFKKFFTPPTKSSAEDPMLNLEDFGGEYAWSHSEQKWNKIRNSNSFILHFPASEEGSRNNAILTWSAYETQEVESEFGATSVPTRIVANLSIDGIKYVGVDYTALYKENGIPVALKYSLYLKPFTTSLNYNDRSDEISLATSMLKDGHGVIWNIEGTTKFKNSKQEEVTKVELSARYDQLALNASVDAAGANNDSNQDEMHLLSKYSDITFMRHPSNTVIGKVIWEEDEDGHLQPYIKYSDGSKEVLLSYMDPVLDDLEGVMTEQEKSRIKEKVKAKIKSHK